MNLKLKLNKKKLKNLSKDTKALPEDMTPHIGGGDGPATHQMSCGDNDCFLPHTAACCP